MQEITEDVIFHNCEKTKCIDVKIYIDNEGHIIKVPVYLCNVCPDRNIIVGVLVYIKNKLYAIKTKEIISSGDIAKNRNSKIYVGEFEFLFAEECKEDIQIKVLSHYIY